MNYLFIHGIYFILIARSVSMTNKFPVHITPEEFKSEVLKTHPSDVCCPHYAGGILKSSNYQSYCVCVWAKLRQKNIMIIAMSLFTKSPSWKCFLSTVNWKASVSISPFFERFSTKSFRYLDGLVWKAGLTVEFSFAFRSLRRRVDWAKAITSTVYNEVVAT